MNTGWIVFFVILGIVTVTLIVFYFLGRRMQKRQDAQNEQIAQSAQQISMFIIDKKVMRIKDAGLPDIVMQQSNWFTKRAKVPVIRAKVGPQVMNLICDNAIFDTVPVKKEVKATVSGIYVTGVKGIHGKLPAPEQKKKGFFARLSQRISEKGGATPVK